MTLEQRTDVAEALQLLLREIALLSKNRVKGRSSVSLREHKTVSVGILSSGRIRIHLLIVQISQSVSDRKRAAGVTRLGVVGTLDNAHSDLAGDLLQILFG